MSSTLTPQERDWLLAERAFFEYCKQRMAEVDETVEQQVVSAARDANEVIEIALGARLNFYRRAYNIADGGIYGEQERMAILARYEMSPTSAEERDRMIAMTPAEFAVRAVHFGMCFWEGKELIGALCFGDFSGFEPLVGLLDYEHAAARRLCQALLKDWLVGPAALDLSRWWARRQSQDAVFPLMAKLLDWAGRSGSGEAVVALGGSAVEPLVALAKKQGGGAHLTPISYIDRISKDTTNQLARRMQRLLCSLCLVRFGAHQVHMSWLKSFTYYGCRLCSQSREFLDVEAVAVLDSRMAQEQPQQDGVLRVNWLPRRSLFDFDRVEILAASDEDVERFCVQVGNDADPFRKGRYRQMRCLVAPECRLSENTLRILRSMFGNVEVRA